MPTLQAFILYEEAIPDSKAEITALQSIAGVLHRCHVFGRENRDILVHKATGYSAKLLKKADQCRAVCTCSHLYWQDEVGLPVCVAFPDCVVCTCFHLCWQDGSACSPRLCVSVQHVSAYTSSSTTMGVFFDAHIAVSAEHVGMELHLYLVVAQPWQGPGLPCTISALALPYLMLPVKDPRHYSMDMLWQCAEDLQACRFAVLAAPESKSCWQAGL